MLLVKNWYQAECLMPIRSEEPKYERSLALCVHLLMQHSAVMRVCPACGLTSLRLAQNVT